MSAFVGSLGVKVGGLDVAKCDIQEGSFERSSVVMMACRRNLKYEKRLRNSEFARSHRKKVVRVNRRTETQQKSDSDALYLSEIFKTMNFAPKEEEPRERRDRGDRGDRGNREDRN